MDQRHEPDAPENSRFGLNRHRKTLTKSSFDRSVSLSMLMRVVCNQAARSTVTRGDTLMRRTPIHFLSVLIAGFAVIATLPTAAQDRPDVEDRLEGGPTEPEKRELSIEPLVTGPEAMTNQRINGLLEKIGEDVSFNGKNMWEFSIGETPVQVITDEQADRMRIIVPIDKAANMTPDTLQRLMQANFDSALDSRYALARGVVWATYIHPLSALTDRQFISGVGQTVNLSRNFGTTFSSGALVFGGGDSGDIIARELINDLLKKGGQEI